MFSPRGFCSLTFWTYQQFLMARVDALGLYLCLCVSLSRMFSQVYYCDRGLRLTLIEWFLRSLYSPNLLSFFIIILYIHIYIHAFTIRNHQVRTILWIYFLVCNYFFIFLPRKHVWRWVLSALVCSEFRQHLKSQILPPQCNIPDTPGSFLPFQFCQSF